MQNWQHVEDLACALNLRPRSLRPDMDFARIAERFLGAHAHEFRQNIVLQPFPDALTNALLARGGVQGAGLSRNFAGAVVFRALEFGPALVKQGVVQRFKRVDGGGGAEARLGCFESAVLPALLKQKHTLVFVPSFFDLVRLRKLFRQAAQGREDVFAVCSEYTPAKDVARARGEFFHGRVRVLLVSERFHYYFRYRLRGVARVVFYAPPSHPRFYAEILGLARGCTGGGGGQQEEALTLFQPADALELERCVGTSAARRLLSAQAKVRDWCFE
jgi:U3 small nucleolar RNA-associated protein 25